MTRSRFFLAAFAALAVAPAMAQDTRPIASTYRDPSGNTQPAVGMFCVPAKDGTGCPTGGGSGAATPTGTAGSPNAAVVSVQGVAGGTPQNVTNTQAAGVSDREQGDVANGATDAGNPVKIGGRASTSLPTVVSDGQRVNQWFGGYGQAIPGSYGTTMGDGAFNAGTVGVTISHAGAAIANAMVPFNVNPANAQVYYPRGDATGSWVNPKGGAAINTGQVSVGTAATLIRAADAGRSSISVIVGAANACAFGPSGVTLTTGYLLPAAAGATDTTATAAALYGVCTAATTVSYKVLLP